MKLNDFMKKIEEIRNNFLTDDVLWEDPDFPCLHDSLFKNKDLIKKMTAEYKSITWKRPHQINKDAVFCLGEKSKTDMKFGAMSDGVFTGALAMVAIHEYIENLFVDTDSFLKLGYAAFQFFKNGEWRYVIVDTQLPYSDISKCHIFSECNEPKEF